MHESFHAGPTQCSLHQDWVPIANVSVYPAILYVVSSAVQKLFNQSSVLLQEEVALYASTDSVCLGEEVFLATILDLNHYCFL